MPFTIETITKLRGIVDASCADEKKGIPGATVVVVGKDGNDLFAHSSGKRGIVSSEPMTLDHIFWIASSTKMLVGLACMQLVENGSLRLDDGEHLENLCPELRTLQVLRPDGTFEKKNKAITLRMLLTHTAGFGYTFFNERLRDWSFPAGTDEFSGRFEDMLMPLLFQPGEGWEYGVSIQSGPRAMAMASLCAALSSHAYSVQINIDWAGIALERATGLKLNDYLQRHIFQPLGLPNMSMIPTQEMRDKLAYMHAKDQEGTLRPRDHLLRMPLVVSHDNKAEAAAVFHSGGAGMFAKPQEYCSELSLYDCYMLKQAPGKECLGVTNAVFSVL